MTEQTPDNQEIEKYLHPPERKDPVEEAEIILGQAELDWLNEQREKKGGGNGKKNDT